MTKAMAYKILGITPGTALTDIKKKYRQLMHRVHPDTEAFSTRAYDFTAQEINEAYDFLRKNRTDSFLGQVTKILHLAGNSTERPFTTSLTGRNIPQPAPQQSR